MPRVGAGEDAVLTGLLALRSPGRSRRLETTVRRVAVTLGPLREERREAELLWLANESGPLEPEPGVPEGGSWKDPAMRFSMSSTCVLVRGTRSRSPMPDPLGGVGGGPEPAEPLPPAATLAGGVQLSSARRKAWMSSLSPPGSSRLLRSPLSRVHVRRSIGLFGLPRMLPPVTPPEYRFACAWVAGVSRSRLPPTKGELEASAMLARLL